MGWAADEFNEVDLGDKRLNARLVKLCDSFSEAPESPINQACEDWAETKAAYRFFQNENVDVGQIMAAHCDKTSMRATNHSTILALQDTSYLVYTNHPKTQGLGKISMKKGKQIDKIYSRGLVMHTCLAVTTEGTPLGLLDQKIFARKLRPDHKRRKMGKKHIHDVLPVEEKESFRWIEALDATMMASAGTQVVTVCDRECDFYDFFKAADQKSTSVLVRASQNRTVNRDSRYAEKDVKKLWDHIVSQPEAGSYIVNISAVQQTRHSKGRTARTAQMGIKFGEFRMNPPRNNPKHKTETLPDIKLFAIHVLEKHPPEGEEPVEWMLLTNQPVTTLEEACERVHWYSLRWRIEMYFKVLKSGFRVEACRLGTADRLICYLTVMSIVAWRLFMITLIARTNPSLPCSQFLSEQEWTVLAAKSSRNGCPPTRSPTIADALIWIAKLGGHLARKGDGSPGTLTLWRGWKRLTDLTEGWALANHL
ncbi:MAG: IS4 family transposase [Phycisphaeraceae bacterium]|nr:IS4 family transposase [Phycisphaeraceae bacterium]